jgi:hypothetical protein
MKQYIILSLVLIMQANLNAQIKRNYEDSGTLLNRLNTYHSDTVKAIYYTNFCYNVNVSKQVEKKILSLIKGEWTDTEVNAKVENFLKSVNLKNEFEFKFWNKGIKDTVINLSLNRRIYFDSAFHLVYDSFQIAFKKDIAERIRQSIVPDEIVLATATCKIINAIPVLKNSLATGDRKHNKNVAELALAGLGEPYFQELFFKEHDLFIKKFKSKEGLVSNHWTNLLFDSKVMEIMSTQKSIYLLHEWLDTSYTYNANSEGTSINKQYVGGSIVYTILRIVQNKDLHEGFNLLPNLYDFLLPQDGFVTNEQVLFVKNWLIKNKGKYKFYCP